MGIYEAYNTGRGIIYVRAKTSVEEDKSGNQSLVINEIPYMVNKARMLEKIAELVKDKKIDGIREIRDESDKDGLRVVIDVKKENQSMSLRTIFMPKLNWSNHLASILLFL